MSIANKQISITAYDMLFFGTGRPFTMEDESWAKGIFPPYPSTLYGYLRSVFFENNMDDFKDANITGKDDSLKFEINSFCIHLIENGKEIQLYPIPFGHVLNENKEIEALSLVKQNFIANNSFDYVMQSNSKGKLETLDNKYYISKQQLENYLNGKRIAREDCYKLTDYLLHEERIGIATDIRSGKTVDGKLYRIEFNNLIKHNFKENTSSEIQFKLDVTANLPIHTTRTLGGEGKIGIMNACSIEKIEKPEQQLEAVIYFNTPAKFDYTILEVFGKVQTIANDNAVYIGGWDMQKRIPKPLQQMYPAGTVIFIKFTDTESIANFKTTFINNKIGGLTQEGFGQFFLGNQKNK